MEFSDEEDWYNFGDEAQLEQMLRDAESDVSLEVTLLPYLPTMYIIAGRRQWNRGRASGCLPGCAGGSAAKSKRGVAHARAYRQEVEQPSWSRGRGKRGGRGTTSTSSTARTWSRGRWTWDNPYHYCKDQLQTCRTCS